MKDIVVELRNASNQPTEAILIGSDLLIDAADEIERLRSKLAQQESETADPRRDLPA